MSRSRYSSVGSNPTDVIFGAARLKMNCESPEMVPNATQRLRGAWVRIPQTSFLNSFFDRRPPWWGKEGKAPVRPRRALALAPPQPIMEARVASGPSAHSSSSEVFSSSHSYANLQFKACWTCCWSLRCDSLAYSDSGLGCRTVRRTFAWVAFRMSDVELK